MPCSVEVRQQHAVQPDHRVVAEQAVIAALDEPAAKCFWTSLDIGDRMDAIQGFQQNRGGEVDLAVPQSHDHSLSARVRELRTGPERARHRLAFNESAVQGLCGGFEGFARHEARDRRVHTAAFLGQERDVRLLQRSLRQTHAVDYVSDSGAYDRDAAPAPIGCLYDDDGTRTARCVGHELSATGQAAQERTH
jgi:hypothetical protein